MPLYDNPGNYEVSVPQWEKQNDQLPDREFEIEADIFDFECFTGKSGVDFVKFGFRAPHPDTGEELLLESFYGLTTKNGKSMGWMLARDMERSLGRTPAPSEIQVPDEKREGCGKTGPVKFELIGKRVVLGHVAWQSGGGYSLEIDGPVAGPAAPSAVDFDM